MEVQRCRVGERNGGSPMPLRFTGTSSTDGDAVVRYEAFDGDKQVFVIVSTEVIEGRGEKAALDMAFDKYATGFIEGDGTVRVFGIDFVPGGRPGQPDLSQSPL